MRSLGIVRLSSFFLVQGTQSGPVSLRIFVEASDNAAPLSAMVSGITSRVNSNHGVQWSPDSWPSTQNVQMSADIGGLSCASASPRVSARNGL